MATLRIDPMRLGTILTGRRVVHCGVAAVLLACFIVSVSPAFDEAGDGGGGLTGLLPAEAPAGLDFEAWMVLDGAWAEWSEAAGDEVAAFYEMEDASIEEQREAVDKLKKLMAVMKTALEDSRYRSLFDPLTVLHGRLARRVDLYEAILDTQELTPEDAKASMMAGAADRVERSTAALENEMNRIRGAAAWLTYVRADELKSIGSDPEAGDAAADLAREVYRRLDATGALSQDQQEFLDRPSFNDLKVAVGKYVEATDREISAPDAAAMHDQLSRLIAAIEEHESDNQSTSASEIRSVYGSLGDLALDGGLRLRGVLARHYLNYNFLVVASEDFIGRAIRETRTESRGVNDYVAGASVRGSSTTSMTTAVDLKPSSNGMLFDAVLNGVTRSSTSGSTSQATIYSQGNHTFRAAREVYFDGENFAVTGPGRINVNPQTYHTGARTSYDGGLFAGTARRRAMSTARSRTGQSNAHTRRKITEQVLPEFNQEVIKNFSELSTKVEDEWHKPLRESGLFPDSQSIATTDRYLYINNRVASPSELGGDVRSPTFAPGGGATIHVHESVLNNVFAKVNLAGRAMTEVEVRDELERAFDDFFGVEVDLSPTEEEAAAAAEEGAEGEEGDGEAVDEEEDDATMQFLFAETDPIRFEIGEGTISLILRTGLRREGKDDIPTQVITVPLTYQIDGDKVMIERGSVRVAAMDRSQTDFAQAGVLRKRVQSAFPSRSRDRKLTVENEDGPPLVMYVSKVKALDGWLGIWLD